nr:myrosinase 1 isoform X2 [Bombyx mori]
MKFPPGFRFGAATAAYQIEGSWNVSDKAESVWDRFTHEHKYYVDSGSNGDVACDSYNRWKDDVRIAKELNLHFYRFSISWPRLLPTAFSNKISDDGRNYYNQLIDALLEEGIEPIVTLFHLDLPQRLQDLGGWANPLIIDWFANYARVVFSLYGDRVKTWITINEPLLICEMSYSDSNLAPGIESIELGNYLCAKNVLLAHATAWRIYDEEFRPKYHGKVSLTNILIWYEPTTGNDSNLGNLANQLCNGIYTHPIFSKTGNWPQSVIKIVDERSKLLGYPYSLLPEFTKKEIEFIKGTYDFFGMNYYISKSIRKSLVNEHIPLWPLEGVPILGAILESQPTWTSGATKWFSAHPPGLRKVLNWIRHNYGDQEIYIMENGYATADTELEDFDRISYLKDHLEQVLLAMKDGVNVTRYTIWSLMDNFEWSDGYTIKFGLYEVDFSSPERTRTPRKSAEYYKNVIETHSLSDFYVKNEL